MNQKYYFHEIMRKSSVIFLFQLTLFFLMSNLLLAQVSTNSIETQSLKDKEDQKIFILSTVLSEVVLTREENLVVDFIILSETPLKKITINGNNFFTSGKDYFQEIDYEIKLKPGINDLNVKIQSTDSTFEKKYKVNYQPLKIIQRDSYLYTRLSLSLNYDGNPENSASNDYYVGESDLIESDSSSDYFSNFLANITYKYYNHNFSYIFSDINYFEEFYKGLDFRVHNLLYSYSLGEFQGIATFKNINRGEEEYGNVMSAIFAYRSSFSSSEKNTVGTASPLHVFKFYFNYKTFEEDTRETGSELQLEYNFSYPFANKSIYTIGLLGGNQTEGTKTSNYDFVKLSNLFNYNIDSGFYILLGLDLSFKNYTDALALESENEFGEKRVDRTLDLSALVNKGFYTYFNLFAGASFTVNQSNSQPYTKDILTIGVNASF